MRGVVGNRKASSYTFRFLNFLRYQYELIRRSNQEEKKPFKIVCQLEEVAIALKMPESVYKRKKDRALKILNDAYFVAKELGYLIDYSRADNIDTLIFNEQKYHAAENSYEEGQKRFATQFSTNAHKLWNFFNEEKQQNDPKHKISESLKSAHLKEFENILTMWSMDEVMEVIKWGLRLKLWHTSLSTPAKLRQNMSQALKEMRNQQNQRS